MEDVSAVTATIFDKNDELHQKHLKLKGLPPKTIEAVLRAIRRVGDDFAHQIDDLSEADLVDYFTDLRDTHSWSSVKLDLYGLKFYYEHILKKPWVAPSLIKPPRSLRVPDIITVEETERIFRAMRILSYRVFFFTLYSLGLRLGEGLRLTVADIDGARARVHIRDAKGNKDRRVPLPTATYHLLRRFWQRHRNPVWLFPNRHGGLAGACTAKTPLDPGGVQKALKSVVESCGHRLCPHCQHHESQQWLECQMPRLLPADHFLLTFTLPAEFRGLTAAHAEVVLDLLRRVAWETRHTFSQNDRQLQGTPGAIAVRHTHSRRLDFHPHVPIVVPAAAVEAEKQRGQRKRRGKKGTYLFNEKAMAKVFRAKMLAAIEAAGIPLPVRYPLE